MHKKRISVFTVASLILLIWAGSLAAQDVAKLEDLVIKAARTFERFSADPEMNWFRNNLENAHGIMIVPRSVKAGFIFGGSGGSGVFLTRDSQSGEWSYPAYYSMGSVTFGAQIGGDVSEIILLVMTEKGIDSLLSGSMKLGGDVSVAAGPVGAGVGSKTSDILTYIRSKGAFAGATVAGAIISPRDKWNAAYYGKKDVRPIDIIVHRSVVNLQSDPLRAVVEDAAKKK